MDSTPTARGPPGEQEPRFNPERRRQRKEQEEAMDLAFGFERPAEGEIRLGYVLNMVPTSIYEDDGTERSGLDVFFQDTDGSVFKGTLAFRPYFYLFVVESHTTEVISYLERKYGSNVVVLAVPKVDLERPNHLSGKPSTYLRISFRSVSDLLSVRKDMQQIIRRNRSFSRNKSVYQVAPDSVETFMEAILDIREYDVPYYVRVCIDEDIRTGAWYKVTSKGGFITMEWQKDMVEKAEPRVLAFDIECTKDPLKFPNSEKDRIFMISYMCDGRGFLIINREIVSEDIDDFEYTPKPEYHGPFHVFNEPTELVLLQRFLTHIKQLRPNIFVTFNGDSFDWPFIQDRCRVYDIEMSDEIGVRLEGEEFRGHCSVHMDAFAWVERDSYLPQGSHGLKAVTRSKLGYDPVEVPPEDMLRFAVERPHYMATYSVSDAVATYYLYMQYVHLFVFSLCTIIPMNAEDVLRKGSGTLCEMLLQVEAFRGNIVCPNKQVTNPKSFHNGHWIQTDTYIGGHVECLESGVFRTDIPVKLKLDPTAFQYLIDTLDFSLTFHIEVEEGYQRCDVTNYYEVRQEIVEKLEMLRETPVCLDTPVIYHLDVAAMYPNIILTNRLQPSAIVDFSACAACLFNSEENQCKRRMKWEWRGDMFPLKKGEFQTIERQLEQDSVGDKAYVELGEEEQLQLLRTRVKEYCRKSYGKVKVVETEFREATVCQRENPFYVNTVRSFRDRRYEYKILTKVEEAKNKTRLYDSLQLAHKCILNSFYGYVMRKGSRWMSMEMAGIVTHTGATLITKARELVERIGRPLELDTDGIWCILPASFPDQFTFRLSNGKSLRLSYPCCMLNSDTHMHYTNHQYQMQMDGTRYSTRSECSIFFELDGPYRAMVLPASLEEGKLLKKRYAVFNMNGSLAELKGFELKRRGELKIIKIFQSQVFEKFLSGSTLQECYQEVGHIANYWLDVLYKHGETLEDEELFELISEEKSMSRKLDAYGAQKSTAITTATRLSEFLGAEMVQDKGLNCKYIISKKPMGSSTTERAIPTVIFDVDPDVRNRFLRRWCKDSAMSNFNVRSILDWEYYIDRFGKCVQKIVTIPAVIQGMKNPVPRIVHESWVVKMIQERLDTRKQMVLTNLFEPSTIDVEDLFRADAAQQRLLKQKSPNPKQRALSDAAVVEIETAESGALVEAADPEVEAPDMRTDFAGWYSVRKKEWSLLRQAQRRRREEVMGLPGEPSAKRPSLSTSRGLFDYLVQHSRFVSTNYWQIVEIFESNSELLLWAFTSPVNLQLIRIDVERVFYVNSSLASLPLGRKVSKVLPRHEKALHLFEISLSGQEFAHPSAELQSILDAQTTKGVYEMNVDPLFRAVLSVGCLSRVSKQSRAKASSGMKFSLSDLEFLTAASYAYLEPTTAGYLQVFFYTVSSGDHGLWLVAAIHPSTSGRRPLKLHFYEYEGSSPDITRPNLKSLFQETPDASSFEPEFHYTRVKTLEELLLSVNQLFLAMTSEHRGPSLVFCQSDISKPSLRVSLSALSDYPLVPIVYVAADAEVPADSTWRVAYARSALFRLSKLESLWQEKLQIARFAHVPVGNLYDDIAVETSDIFYGRQLALDHHVLWNYHTSQSYAQLPDELNLINSASDMEINESGVFRSLCVEVRLRNFIVNATLSSELISDAEGLSVEDLSEQLGASSSSFRSLKALLNRWIECCQTATVAAAEYCIEHSYRWISCRKSIFYDPSLHQMVKRLIAKSLAILKAEIEKLGVRVILVTPERLIFCTNQYRLESAHSYFDFIVGSLHEHELFRSVEFVPVYYWDALAWMDPSNFGGILAEELHEAGAGGTASQAESASASQRRNSLDDFIVDDHLIDLEESVGSSRSSRKIYFQWLLGRYLPQLLDKPFQIVLAKFLSDPLEHRERLLREHPEYTIEETKERLREFVEGYLRGDLQTQLIRLVPQIRQSVAQAEGDDRLFTRFPKFAGSHLSFDHPALEFIKSLTHILSLDSDTQDTIHKLRDVLLKQIGDPSLSLLIPDVICVHCNSCRSIDICRDLSMQLPVQESPWRCPDCGERYSTAAIESKLVRMFETTIALYQSQDLVCIRCHMIKEDNLGESCPCSGHYAPLLLSGARFAERVKPFRAIATYHSLAWLSDVLRQYSLL